MPVFTIELPNGKRIDAEADNEDAALSGAQEWYKQQQPQQQTPQQPQFEDTSLVSAVQQGATNVMQGVGSTIKNYISKDAGAAVEGAAAAKSNPNYKSASQEFANPSDGADKHFLGVDWSSAPRALIEQAPALATDLLTQMVLRKAGPLAKLAGGALTYGARTAGNEAQKRADARTGEEGSEPSAEDKLIGLGSTAAQGALNAYGAGKIVNPAKVTGTGLKGVAQTAGNVVKAAGAEGATNAAQHAISDAGATVGTDKGLSIDLQGAKADGLLGMVGGGVFGAGRGVKDVAQSLNTRGSDFGEHSTMAANRVVEKAGRAKDLENPETAFSAVKGAQADVKTELSEAAKTITAPSRETANALARAKQGGILTENELSAIDAEGNDGLSSLVRQQNALGKLTKNGSFNEGEQRFAGGLSETIRNHSGKLASVVGGMGALPHIAANGAASLDSLASAIPGVGLALGAGGIGYQLLKVGERFAGVRSPARSFADKFADETAQLRPDAPPPPEPPEPSQADLLKSQNTLESGLQKMVEKLQREKRQQLPREAMPLLKQLAARNKLMQQPAPVQPEQPVAPTIAEPKAVNTQGATPQSPQEGESILQQAQRAREQSQPEAVPPIPARQGESIVQQALAAMRAQNDRAKAPPGEASTEGLPESPYWHLEPKEAAEHIYHDALTEGKTIDHPEYFKDSIVNRLEGEQRVFHAIANEMPIAGQAKLQKYFSAMWGADSPTVMRQVKAHMLAAMPEQAAVIEKHLTEGVIEKLWTPKRTKNQQKKKA